MLINEPEVRPSLIIYGDATEIVQGRVISKPEEDISHTDVIETDDDMGDEQAGSAASACPTKKIIIKVMIIFSQIIIKIITDLYQSSLLKCR